MSEPRKWSWTEFFIGFIKKSFLVWLISTAILVFIILFELLKKDGDLDKIFYWIMAGGWLLFGIIFSLTKAIETAVENAKISLELKASAQANAGAELDKVLEKIKQ